MRPAAVLLAATLTAAAPFALTLPAQAQWTLQPSHTTADLRGIDNVGNGIAWASGTNGTILRSTDSGAHWQRCTIPPNAEHLDFRGIQAFDATTAIAMSSGPGDQSRLYKTTDACQTWTLLFTNPDKTGFWDALRIIGPRTALIIGDPIPHTEFEHFRFRRFFHFPLYGTTNGGDNWDRLDENLLFAMSDDKGKAAQSIFAASNSSILFLDRRREFAFVTGGKRSGLTSLRYTDQSIPLLTKGSSVMSSGANDALASGSSAGGFSIAADADSMRPTLVIVGGDYTKPEQRLSTASSCTYQLFGRLEILGKWDCRPAETMPHGFRSAVAYDAPTKTWITVGPNGTDISTDDGRNWRPLHPAPNEPADADQHWNALSLPYVVGPHGRIGILRPTALIP